MGIDLLLTVRSEEVLSRSEAERPTIIYFSSLWEIGKERERRKLLKDNSQTKQENRIDCDPPAKQRVEVEEREHQTQQHDCVLVLQIGTIVVEEYICKVLNTALIVS